MCVIIPASLLHNGRQAGILSHFQCYAAFFAYFEHSMENTTLIGPFSQLLTMRGLPVKGPLTDNSLEIIENGAILVKHNQIQDIGTFEALRKQYPESTVEEITKEITAVPGLIDMHTHICFAGSRAMDFAARNSGKTYLEIAKEGGGIWSTVKHTRAATTEQLSTLMSQRMTRLLNNGVTTVEVKSGYGLSPTEELKLLRAINEAGSNHKIDVVPTCLAAHIVPKDFDGNETDYLKWILEELVPVIQKEELCYRFDIFTEESAFSTKASLNYLSVLKKLGFDLTVHGDQFTPGGSGVAIQAGALSVDHLEASTEKEIAQLAKSDVMPVALPGASIGIGCAFTPARKLLDAGCGLAIASDWNPGSAPQGDLLTQASILASFEKLSTAEVFAAITFRAAIALGRADRGILDVGLQADIAAYPTADYREILYKQGSMKPSHVWKSGELIVND